jgi:colanic acid/amylovoran biosynthesis glycosyltransferase
MAFPDDALHVGFVVKRYPRYSETFVVREILAHERAGLEIEIFSLRPSDDTHFQDLISRVRGPVHHLCFPAPGLQPDVLTSTSVTAANFWLRVADAARILPDLWTELEGMCDEQARDVYQAAQIAYLVRQSGIQHLHAPFASDAATVARMAARMAGVSYSFTARAKDIFHASVDPEDLRQKLRDAAGVVTISDYHLDYLRRTFGPLAAHVQRIYNGLDLEEFPYRRPDDRPPVIVAVGRLVEKKGFDDLIDACALLAVRGREFRCRIAGVGSMQTALQQHIERCRLQDRLKLIGPRPQNEIARVIQAAAVLAAPCIVGEDGDRDGLPNVIQEALALGTPVISTDVTGIPEVVRDGETGLLVPQRNPTALADALDRVLADAGLRVRLAEAARRFMEKEFDIHRNTARRRALFRSAIERPKEALVREIV